MKIKLFGILTITILMASCQAKQNKSSFDSDTNVSSQNYVTDKTKDNPNTIEIDCDSIYKGKKYKLKLISLGTQENEADYNYIFLAFYKKSGHDIEFFGDTIESTAQEIKFIDFNNDRIKDILIQNVSDVRSNWTYYLYLTDTIKNRLTTIKGFEEIKNPNFVSKYNLIDNYVNSGTNWTSFYKIQGDKVIDSGIVIYDDLNENNYQEEYRKAINTILKDKSR